MRIFEYLEDDNLESRVTISFGDNPTKLSLTNNSINRSINSVLNLPVARQHNNNKQININTPISFFFEKPIILNNEIYFIEMVCNQNTLTDGNYRDSFKKMKDNNFNKEFNVSLADIGVDSPLNTTKLNFITNQVNKCTNIFTIHCPSFRYFEDATFEQAERVLKDEINKTYQKSEKSPEKIISMLESRMPIFDSLIYLPKFITPILKIEDDQIKILIQDQYKPLIVNHNDDLMANESIIKINDSVICDINFDDYISQKEILSLIYGEVIDRFITGLSEYCEQKIITNIIDYFENYTAKTIDLKHPKVDDFLLEKATHIFKNVNVFNGDQLLKSPEEIKELHLKNRTKSENEKITFELKGDDRFNIMINNPFSENLANLINRSSVYGQNKEDQEFDQERERKMDNNQITYYESAGLLDGWMKRSSRVKNGLVLPAVNVFQNPKITKLTLDHELNHFLFAGSSFIKEKFLDFTNWLPINDISEINFVDENHSIDFYSSLYRINNNPLTLLSEPTNYIQVIDPSALRMNHSFQNMRVTYISYRMFDSVGAKNYLQKIIDNFFDNNKVNLNVDPIFRVVDNIEEFSDLPKQKTNKQKNIIK